MPDEDARLTDFLPDDEEGTSVGGETTPVEEETAPDEEQPSPDEEQPSPDDTATPDDVPSPNDAAAPDPAAVEPAVPTATWRPGASCEACGTAVERRWYDGEALVCADCKEW